MEEVREWAKGNELHKKLRSAPGVAEFEFSFCPGEGWLAARYKFADIEDMKKFLESPELEEAKKVVSAAPHYDNSRTHHEFKGFFLEDA